MLKVCTKIINHKCVEWKETDEGLEMTANSCPPKIYDELVKIMGTASKGVKFKINKETEKSETIKKK